MRVVLQRVKYAQVKVNDACIGKIEKGFMLLVGITPVSYTHLTLPTT